MKDYHYFYLKPIKFQCCPQIETSQLICKADMRAALALNGLKIDVRLVF